MSELTRRYRYDERSEVFKRTREGESYISDETLNAMLDAFQWKDYTFVFIEHSTGFRTRVINNITDSIVLLDDLDGMAYEYCKTKLVALSLLKTITNEEKSQDEINKIRSNLNSKLEESQHDKRFAKYNSNNRRNDKQSEKVAQ